MLVRLAHARLDTALPLLQLGLVAAVLRVDAGWGKIAALALLLAASLYGWTRTLRHARLIADTPTSRIASAAQGYVELRGRAQALEGSPLHSPVDGLPVLWYRLLTERRESDGKWRTVNSIESNASFLLDDGSGICAVDPDGAEMLVRRRDVSTRGDIRYTQWSLIRHDTVYALGDFATLGSISPDFDSRTQVRELLAAWKADRAELLRRFDLDGNGELDLREWELARQEAKREVRRRQAEMQAAPEAHVMRKPPGGRLFLISDLDPDRIARRYRWLAAFHLAVFLGAVVSTARLGQIGAL
ncbi:hypothetical protein [Thauera linaloolentis]|uniref:EF-hand domain-containing protein n=1 Tax=Thauera linaloolentis (strain DSM 12138 / JCM 21573 / CCUG 41526 / CIP 105981 / IAM 15112 / NBRC 102519 / 47Lol) TaxID=1123367 RepID=N6Y6G2_THAL4|nr:hypothetical protein [Thauera linaloolentis]ENO89786.1 hypothetical protein C666_04415 [Thauera linaloolentis 47Lol = DSM 12138]MCM8567025.1 hypothetical protein [Thauera linaloolentis]